MGRVEEMGAEERVWSESVGEVGGWMDGVVWLVGRGEQVGWVGWMDGRADARWEGMEGRRRPRVYGMEAGRRRSMRAGRAIALGWMVVCSL